MIHLGMRPHFDNIFHLVIENLYFYSSLLLFLAFSVNRVCVLCPQSAATRDTGVIKCTEGLCDEPELSWVRDNQVISQAKWEKFKYYHILQVTDIWHAQNT